MKSTSSMTIGSTAAESKRKTTAAAVVARKSRKRSSAVVTPPPRPSSSASGGLDNTQVVGEPPVASSSSPSIDIINIKTGGWTEAEHHLFLHELHRKGSSDPLLDLINIDDCDVVNKVVDILFSEEQDKDDSEEQVVGDNDEFSLFDLSIEHDMPPPTTPTSHVVSAQVDGESQVASPPQVFDILNIGTDHFSIIRLSLFNEMTAKELQKFCLKTVGLCDYFAKNDGKMYFALKQEGAFLQRIENNKIVFKSLIDECCKPLSELVFILEPHLLNLFPLLLLGELHMHSDRKIRYPVDGVIERWCFNITDKNMQLQQQGNGKDHVVFPCDHGNLVCMSDTVRGIVDIADGVRLQHGCPKLVMEAVGSKASITIVMDLCFGSKAVKNTVLEQVLSRFTSAVPSDSNSNSIQSLREVATTAVATRSPILLQDIDPNGIVKDAIDEKKALLLSTCARYQCNEKTDEGTRYCTTCVQGNKECCVEHCMDNRHSPERDCRYCKRHSDPKTRCRKCNRGLVEGSETKLCSTCLVEAEAIAKKKNLAARVYSRSEARRCTFSNEHCNKIQQSGCNKMCKEHYRQTHHPTSVAPLLTEEEKRQSEEKRESMARYLVNPSDVDMIPPYMYSLMRQVEPCLFTEADRLLARSKGPVGYPGFQCRHCNGHTGLGKYFPVSSKSFSRTSQNIHAHMLICRKCPEVVKEQLIQLKIEKSRAALWEWGWRKVFFDKVWHRLHYCETSSNKSGSSTTTSAT